MQSFVQVLYLMGDEESDSRHIDEEIVRAEEEGWELEQLHVIQPTAGAEYNAGVVLHFTKD